MRTKFNEVWIMQHGTDNHTTARCDLATTCRMYGYRDPVVSDGYLKYRQDDGPEGARICVHALPLKWRLWLDGDCVGPWPHHTLVLDGRKMTTRPVVPRGSHKKAKHTTRVKADCSLTKRRSHGKTIVTKLWAD